VSGSPDERRPWPNPLVRPFEFLRMQYYLLGEVLGSHFGSQSGPAAGRKSIPKINNTTWHMQDSLLPIVTVLPLLALLLLVFLVIDHLGCVDDPEPVLPMAINAEEISTRDPR